MDSNAVNAEEEHELHEFEDRNFVLPTFCYVCGNLLLGMRNQGMTCGICNMNVHRACSGKADELFPCAGHHQSPDLINHASKPRQESIDSDESSSKYLRDQVTPHVFQLYSFHMPTLCAYCSTPLLGLTNQGYRCAGCSLPVHKQCADKARLEYGNCPKTRRSKAKLGSYSQLARKNSLMRIKSKELISNPMNARQIDHVSFDRNTLSFQNLPLDTATKGLIFGAELGHQPSISLYGYEARIPLVVLLLGKKILDNNGFNTEGIFRVSANNQDLEYAKVAIDRGTGFGDIPLRSSLDPSLYAAILKHFFRKLPNGGILRSVEVDDFDRLISFRLDKEDTPQNREMIHFFITGADGVLELNERTLLLWLLDLFFFVVKGSAQNLMSVESLSIVIAPTLYEPLEGVNKGLDMMSGTKKITSLIRNCLQYILIAYEPDKFRRDTFGAHSSPTKVR